MKRLTYHPPRAQWSAAFLILLAVVPRLIGLEHRPLMHDESLFAFYSYIFFNTGSYTHIPMLHGPTLMLATGSLFHLFGDSIAVGRAFVALISIVGLFAGAALWPRRYRWWLAPLLFTSPILLFYSRFFRDDMIVSTMYLLATLGVAHGLSRRGRFAPLWAVLGGCFLLAPLAVMESALFFQAAGVTFGLVWLSQRFFWRGPTLELREAPRPPLREYHEASHPPALPEEAPRRHRRREINQARAAAVAMLPPEAPPVDDPPTEAESASPEAPAPLRRSWLPSLRLLAGWALGLLLGAAFVLFVYGITNEVPARPPGATKPASTLVTNVHGALLNMKASWDYWKDQHQQHRIEGPLHYHLPILLTYELPVLLLIGIGLVWDACLRRRRALVYAVALGGWVWIWIFWRLISYVHFFPLDPARNLHAPPGFLRPLTSFLHIEPGLSMLLLGLLIVPLLVWSILALREHHTLAAWMGWWAACSLFQYSSAGEKVPWLALHIALPLYMTLGWLWAPRLRRLGRPGLALALGVLAVATLIAMRDDYYLIGARAADPRERLVYNHTPLLFDKLCREHILEWRKLAASGVPAGHPATPLRQRNVLLVDAPGWPGVWYFRDCAYQLLPVAPSQMPANADLVIGNKDLLQGLADKVDRTRWLVTGLSLRDHWMAPWPDRATLDAAALAKTPAAEATSLAGTLWDYYWMREPWTEPGNFPIIVIEPLKPRP